MYEMPKKTGKRHGGLTKGPPVDYNILTERAAPKGRFRIIVSNDGIFSRLEDATSLIEAKRTADAYVVNYQDSVAYVHSESNRVLYRTEM